MKKELTIQQQSVIFGGGKCSLKDGVLDAASAGIIGAIGGPWSALIGAGGAAAACIISNMH